MDDRTAQYLVTGALSLSLPFDACEAITAPLEGLAEFRIMHYQEYQQDSKRMRVKAQSSRLILPISEQLSAEVAQVVDAVSGASPLYYTDPAVFGTVKDLRQAKDAKFSVYGERQRLSLGAHYSDERDYRSNTQSIAYTWTSPAQNISLDLAFAKTDDLINPVNQLVRDERKTVRDRLLAITAVISPTDLLQLQRTVGSGIGYFSDPYKLLDSRPNQRSTQAWVVRWHHHSPSSQSTSRVSFRRLSDSFGIRSDTAQWEIAKALSERNTLTPGIRIYSQSKASFFSSPDPANPSIPNLPPDYQFGETLLSFDQRLSQLGAVNLSLKWEHSVGRSIIDLRVDHYLQKNRWSWHGRGTPGLADFSATTWQLGWRRPFNVLSH